MTSSGHDPLAVQQLDDDSKIVPPCLFSSTAALAKETDAPSEKGYGCYHPTGNRAGSDSVSSPVQATETHDLLKNSDSSKIGNVDPFACLSYPAVRVTKKIEIGLLVQGKR